MRTRASIAAVTITLASATQALAQGNTPPPVNIQVPQPPPADRPLITRIPKPSFAVEGGAGLLGYVTGAGRLGPSWNVRVTADFTPRVGLEASYVGAANRRSDNTGTLTLTSLDAGVRYNILRADEAPVQPYVAVGIGYAGWAGPGGTPAAVVLPITVGVERLLTEHVKVGARLNLRPAFFDDLGHGNEKNAPGGDSWSLTAGAGGAF